MADEQLLILNAWIGGRSYRIKVKPEEEEAVRKAVKVANDRIAELRNSYAGKDDQDFIAMCLLMYAADSATEAGGGYNPLVKRDIADMVNRIDEALAE